MDAIVTAGGIPKPDEPLYPFTQGESKALLDIAGKPMIQWVLDALSGSQKVEQVLIIGLPAESGLTCRKQTTFIPNQGSMLENVRAGVIKVLELNPASRHVLLVSSDIPAITPDMVDWAIQTALETDDDLYYNLISQEVMEKRFPGSKRSYTKLKGATVCGGDMNVVRTMVATGNDELWERIVAARKSALKQAAILGFDTLILLLLRVITLEQAVKRVSKRVGLKGRVILSPYAELGMDIDKPHQLEILRAELGRGAKA
jgi:GTP:adenosylcobinamide-phosphate guanylyltransferase